MKAGVYMSTPNISPNEINQLLFEYSTIPKTAFIDKRPKIILVKIKDMTYMKDFPIIDNVHNVLSRLLL